MRKTKAIPSVIISKIQAYPTPSTVKQLQLFWGLLGYFRASVTHLAQDILPLYAWVKKGASWNCTPTSEQAFQGAKHIIKCTQASHALDPARPCELNVHGTQEGFGWGFWKQSEQLHQPLGFWSQLWKGAVIRYSLIEKQLAAVYAALLATEAITGTALMIIRNTYPFAGWV